jgi:acetyltransferase-like isoleucine patch superfamily enzyme
MTRAPRAARARSKIAKKFRATIERGVALKGPLDNLRLGPGAVVQHGTDIHLGGFAWCEHRGSVTIGEGTVISPGCSIWGAGPGGTSIGARCSIGPGVRIVASRDDYTAPTSAPRHIFGAVSIEDDVIIYANCVIGPGVTIGQGAVVAAGSVVIRDVGSFTLVGGAPARVIRLQVRST